MTRVHHRHLRVIWDARKKDKPWVVQSCITTDPQHTEPESDAVARTIARAAGNLEARLELLTPWQVEELKTWRRAQGLARPVGTLDANERARLGSELDHRGWGSPHDLEPEATTDPAEGVVTGDVVDPDLYNDEPF